MSVISDRLNPMGPRELAELARTHTDLKDDPHVQVLVRVVTEGISVPLKGRERSHVAPNDPHLTDCLRECIRLRLEGIVVSRGT